MDSTCSLPFTFCLCVVLDCVSLAPLFSFVSSTCHWQTVTLHHRVLAPPVTHTVKYWLGKTMHRHEVTTGIIQRLHTHTHTPHTPSHTNTPTPTPTHPLTPTPTPTPHTHTTHTPCRNMRNKGPGNILNFNT